MWALVLLADVHVARAQGLQRLETDEYKYREREQKKKGSKKSKGASTSFSEGEADSSSSEDDEEMPQLKRDKSLEAMFVDIPKVCLPCRACPCRAYVHTTNGPDGMIAPII